MPLVNGPQPFEVKLDDGNCAVDWANWLRGFEIFLKANEVKKKFVKRDLLLHYAGPKVQDIFFNLPEEEQQDQPRGPLANAFIPFKRDAYVEVVAKLQKFFAPKKNLSYERHMFRGLTQKSEERIDAFIMRLRIQANRCDFGDQLNENLKDQIVSGCSSMPENSETRWRQHRQNHCVSQN